MGKLGLMCLPRSRASWHRARARKHVLLSGAVFPLTLTLRPRAPTKFFLYREIALHSVIRMDSQPASAAMSSWRAAQQRACPKLSTGAVGNSEKIGLAIKKQGSNINGRVRASRRSQAWPASHPRRHCLARFEGEGCAKNKFIGLGFPRIAVQVFAPGFEVGFRPQL